MNLFIDSANLDDITEALDVGIIDGITTNPSLVSKEPKGAYQKHIEKILYITRQYNDKLPVSVEVVATTPEEMVRQAKEMHDHHGYEDLVVKIPCGWESIPVVGILSEAGIMVNWTCCFSYSQLLIGALSGAAYVSLFYNRAKDAGEDVLKIIGNYSDSNQQTDLICGSIRSANDITDCFLAGADIVTASLSHLKALCRHLGTEASIKGFMEDFAAWTK